MVNEATIYWIFKGCLREEQCNLLEEIEEIITHIKVEWTKLSQFLRLENCLFRPRLSLLIIFKLFEKLLEKLKPIIENGKVIQWHQFGFRSKYSTVDQVRRMALRNHMKKEKKKKLTIPYHLSWKMSTFSNQI